MFGWLRRRRPRIGGYWGPGIHLLPDVKADPNVLPPSAALVPPMPESTQEPDHELQPGEPALDILE